MGYLAAFISAFFGSAKDLVSKKISFSVDGTASAFASFLFALPFYVILLAVLYALGMEDFAFSWMFVGLVILRSATDAFAEWFKMTSLEYEDISVLSCIFVLSPVFLLVTSPLITGDALTLEGIVGISLIVAGTLLVLYKRTDTASDIASRKRRNKGVLLALGAAFFFSLNSCFDRLAVQIASPALSGFGMTALAAVLLLPLLLRKKGSFQPLLEHKGVFFFRGFLEISFMVAKLFALQFLQAPYVVGIQKSGLLVSIVGGRIFFKELDLGRRLLAGILILAGVLTIVFAAI